MLVSGNASGSGMLVSERNAEDLFPWIGRSYIEQGKNDSENVYVTVISTLLIFTYSPSQSGRGVVNTVLELSKYSAPD